MIMARVNATPIAVCLLQAALLSTAPAAAQPTAEQQAEFLRTAKILKSAPIGKGVTKPFRLTLTDGTLTHDAAFQSVNQERKMSRTGRNGALELKFVDSWRFNIAAHRIATLLGIGDMVPVAVERKWDGKPGAITWWVDDVLMDEQERRRTGAEPPDGEEWSRQQLRMRVFTQLVHDTDRNQGNLLITKNWRLVMIDFTRAFRSWEKLPSPVTTLRRCDRGVLAAMRGLSKEQVRKAAGPYLTVFEVDSLLARRDILVNHFDALVATLGEPRVLY
jgi:hypothetical protein